MGVSHTKARVYGSTLNKAEIAKLDSTLCLFPPPPFRADGGATGNNTRDHTNKHEHEVQRAAYITHALPHELAPPPPPSHPPIPTHDRSDTAGAEQYSSKSAVLYLEGRVDLVRLPEELEQVVLQLAVHPPRLARPLLLLPTTL